MTTLLEKNSEKAIVIQTIGILFYAGEMLLSDAYYMPYLLVAIAGEVCLLKKKGGHCSQYDSIIVIAFSMLLALMVTLANYSIWDVGGLREGVLLMLILFGAFVAFANILLFIERSKACNKKIESSFSDKGVFTATFFLSSLINGTVLFTCKYPGVLTPDSCSQMRQLLTGVYSNHHPFYHTMIIKFFVTIGMVLFSDINAAVATYMVFQILFMAMTFAFAVMSVNKIGAPRWVVILLIGFFVLMPYHIMYSFTMWKDVLFGAVVLLYTLFLYRNLKKTGNRKFNIIGLAISGLGFCLLRSNGLFAFMGTIIIFFFSSSLNIIKEKRH